MTNLSFVKAAAKLLIGGRGCGPDRAAFIANLDESVCTAVFYAAKTNSELEPLLCELTSTPTPRTLTATEIAAVLAELAKPL